IATPVAQTAHDVQRLLPLDVMKSLWPLMPRQAGETIGDRLVAVVLEPVLRQLKAGLLPVGILTGAFTVDRKALRIPTLDCARLKDLCARALAVDCNPAFCHDT